MCVCEPTAAKQLPLCRAALSNLHSWPFHLVVEIGGFVRWWWLGAPLLHADFLQAAVASLSFDVPNSNVNLMRRVDASVSDE
ncbi:hypothetical protein O6P43_032032 [Quillaja saponaria]|uniref:Uncharacterized protein n=1 Tax=Quillaja saponaria TaxID=32244 RepID=A0AAD7KWP1_QUISA|nr:hypothetical protein O6P43_032032 [Quillaja saponaria]